MDPENEGAIEAAEYAASISYPSDTTSVQVVSAQFQMVAGKLYDMNVAVTIEDDGSCSMHNYVVINFADPRLSQPYKLKSTTALTSLECPSE